MICNVCQITVHKMQRIKGVFGCCRHNISFFVEKRLTGPNLITVFIKICFTLKVVFNEGNSRASKLLFGLLNLIKNIIFVE